jgi:hypothetical protein
MMFEKSIDRTNRKAMITFLKGHYRYDTMHSWNRATSYANCIKLHRLHKPQDVKDSTWWELFSLPEWGQVLSDLLDDFARKYDYQWQAGINGRSGGYVVLYQGGIKPSGYQSYCTQCGQRNYQVVPEGEVGICGRCEAKARVNYKQSPMQVFTWPGRGVDMDEDFRDWSSDRLMERVELVVKFDRLCGRIVETYSQLCRDYRITETEIMVPETIKVLEPIC